ncbi:mevalonate kinase [Alkalibacterium iburiense]|uniref:Mevalonate kinase n=1 Tax=Alkalibacterium iburiense TaxID=290589 RepID=A0ABN0XAA7_9LACT
MKTLFEQAIGTAHGKIILMGEHAVVYNEPAIALPFLATPVEVTIEPTDGESRLISSYYQGAVKDVPEALKNIKIVIASICEDLDQPVDFLTITISSLIPPERGMGSSAAVASALVRALFTYFSEPLDYETLLYYVDISEKIAHGNPSGLDARVTSSLSPVYYKKNSAFDPIPLRLSGYIIAADTGMKGQTKQAVEGVAEQMKGSYHATKRVIEALGELTEQAKKAIEENNSEQLGKLMTAAHSHLKMIQVSNEALDHLVDTALEYKALGAKLTGGGRGGCMIALTKTAKQAKRIAHKLMEHGAVETWIHALGVEKND